MGIIKVPERYATNTTYSRIKDASMSIGEQLILVSMWHVNDPDSKDQPRCVCFVPEYGQNGDSTCPYCYGTSFAGGVKELWRSWGIVNDDDEDEAKAKYGVWADENHDVQLEPFPDLSQNDYIFRVQQWDESKGIPLIEGKRYIVSDMQLVSIRTGNRFGGSQSNRVAQKAKIGVLPPEHPIYNYDLRLGAPIPRYDGEPR